jgi:hypothetical protein
MTPADNSPAKKRAVFAARDEKTSMPEKPAKLT